MRDRRRRRFSSSSTSPTSCRRRFSLRTLFLNCFTRRRQRQKQPYPQDDAAVAVADESQIFPLNCLNSQYSSAQQNHHHAIHLNTNNASLNTARFRTRPTSKSHILNHPNPQQTQPNYSCPEFVFSHLSSSEFINNAQQYHLAQQQSNTHQTHLHALHKSLPPLHIFTPSSPAGDVTASHSQTNPLNFAPHKKSQPTLPTPPPASICVHPCDPLHFSRETEQENEHDDEHSEQERVNEEEGEKEGEDEEELSFTQSHLQSAPNAHLVQSESSSESAAFSPPPLFVPLSRLTSTIITQSTCVSPVDVTAAAMRTRLPALPTTTTTTSSSLCSSPAAPPITSSVQPTHPVSAVSAAAKYTDPGPFLIPGLSEILAYPAYWPHTDQFEAERLLASQPDGVFLLRNSSHPNHYFAVSYKRHCVVDHLRVTIANRRFSLSVAPLITSASLPRLFEDSRYCRVPLIRPHPFQLQHLAAAAALSALPHYDAIAQLPLPRPLHAYLRQFRYQPVRRYSIVLTVDETTTATNCATSTENESDNDVEDLEITQQQPQVEEIEEEQEIS